MARFQVVDPATYETRRPQALKQIHEHKKGRRMQLADDISLLWESVRTVNHQVQEMARMEGDDAEAMASIEAEYADLLPSDGRMTATLFVEVREASTIKERLRHYAGLEHALLLRLPDGDVKPQILGDHGSEEATTAVTYFVFDLGATGMAGLDEAKLVVDHRQLRFEAPLPDAVREDPLAA